MYLEHTETVKTDVPYSRIEWYVDNDLRETSHGDGVKTEATFQPYFLIGSALGTDYVIKAIAYPWEGDGSDSDSFTLTVILPYQIVKMEPLDGSYETYSYDGLNYHTVEVETSEPFFIVNWGVEGLYGPVAHTTYRDGGPFAHTTYRDSETTKAYFSPSNLEGSVKGKTYTIVAVAFANRVDEENNNFPMAWDTYTLTVISPRSVSTPHPRKIPNVSGYAELTRFYKSGTDVYVNWYVYAYNSGDVSYDATTEFKNTIKNFWGPGGHKQEPPGLALGPSGPLDEDNRTFDRSGSIPNSLVGGVRGDDKYDCEAYIRLTVSGNNRRADWHFTHNEMFGLGDQ